MRILGACIFLSLLAGNLKKKWMDVTATIEKKFLKKRRMRILSARIFSKFFGGKIKFFKQMLPRKNYRDKKDWHFISYPSSNKFQRKLCQRMKIK